MNEVYAKSKPPKTIREHTRELIHNYIFLRDHGYLCNELTKQLDPVVMKVLTLHDYGKLNFKFQNLIRKQLKKPVIKNDKLNNYPDFIPHEWLSCAFISLEDRKLFASYNSLCPLFTSLIRYCIGFHHTRDMSRYDKTIIDDFILYDLSENKKKLGISYDLNNRYNLINVEHNIFENEEYFRNNLKFIVHIKGILHKCDYTASAGIQAEKKYNGNYTEDFTGWISAQEWKTLHDYQIKAKDLSDKSIIFIASTGAGKTEYAMNWINGDKAFYLLGIRTAVNAMYNRFTEIFTEENVVLLHGNTYLELFKTYNEDKENFDDYFMKLNEIYQLSMPLTVATADQLITSVFKYNSFERIYLTASYSKIIIDEIQSFSPEGIACIITFLKEIHALGGKFLLMTATLPQFIIDELKDLTDIVLPDPVFDSRQRHKIEMINDEIDSDSALSLIKKEIHNNKKVLIICNTVKKAQEMYAHLEDINPNLLHSKFILKDRKKKEMDIMNMNGCGIWITTQIVEASLNIDFDLLFTECSTADSLFQRFGRCYRKREYTGNGPNIYIFNFSGISRYIYDINILKRTFEIMREYNNLYITEEMKQHIILEVFDPEFLVETHFFAKYQRYKKLLALGFKSKSKPEAQNLFRTFTESHTVIPEPVYRNNEKEIRNAIYILESGTDIREKMDAKIRLLDYSLSLTLYDKQKQLLAPICADGSYNILNGTEYSEYFGIKYIDDYEPEFNIL